MIRFLEHAGVAGLLLCGGVASAVAQTPCDTCVFDVHRLGEATATGHRQHHTQNVAAKTLSATDIRRNLGNTFASTLTQVEGVSLVQTGATIAKPVLHGMYGNRLLIVNNGVRQQGQQWGADHAPELDANAAASISVVKGAEAVRYGGEALGGVVLLDAKPLPYGRRTVDGMVSLLYGSNGRRGALMGMADGAFSLRQGDAAWRVQGTYVNGGDRSTADYLLNNTGMREANFSAAAGWMRDHWTVDAYYSLFTTKIGVLYSAQMGEIELLKERIRIGRPTDVKPFSRAIDYPHQQVVHHVARASAAYRWDSGARLRVQAAWQHDDRQEFNLRRNYRSHVPTLDLGLNTLDLDADWKHTYAEHWTSEAGTFFHAIDNQNRPGTGVVPIIPNYTQQNAGGFFIQKYARPHWGAEMGVRLDHRRLSARGSDLYGHLYGGRTQHTNLTYSLGMHWHATPYLDLLTHFGTALRAPHVHELYSNGLEQASGLYAVGDSTLRPEVSRKWVVSARYHRPRLSASVDLYSQWIDRYIYDEPTGEIASMVSGFYPIFRYRSANAWFRGFDADIRWTCLPRLEYAVGGSMVWAEERSTGRYLPFIPPLRLSQSLTWRIGSWGKWHDAYVKGTHRFVAKQTRFDPATDLIPYSPPAYHLFGLEVGTTLTLSPRQRMHLLLTADNLLNRAYRDYTNRFRYYAHDLGRDVRLMATWEF